MAHRNDERARLLWTRAIPYPSSHSVCLPSLSLFSSSSLPSFLRFVSFVAMLLRLLEVVAVGTMVMITTMSTIVMVVDSPEEDQALSSYSRDYLKASLTIFCSNDANVEVVEGDYDVEDENTSVDGEDTSFQVSIKRPSSGQEQRWVRDHSGRPPVL